MSGENEDVFFLSNGHISPAWYSVLARCGYFPIEELNSFRKLETRLQGHPTPATQLPGIRIASGSLGQGLSVAIGCALGKKLSDDKHLVFSLHGDGELQEGQIWEAAMFAAAKNVDNLIATIDYNGKQIDGSLNDVVSLGNLEAKWISFGWTVLKMDGNDIENILKVMSEAKSECFKGKPVVIIMSTIMGKGVSFMENDHKWHGSPPNDEQKNIALNELEETLGDY
jgi:transketolase